MKTLSTDNLPPNISLFEQELAYNALDSMLTQEINYSLEEKLVHPYLETYLWEQRMLEPVLYMMQRGILISEEKKQSVVAELETRKTIVENNFKALCREVGIADINPRSYVQIGKLFWDTLFIPKQPTVKKGKVSYSLDRDALEKISRNYTRAIPFASCLMRLRDLEKMHSALTTDLSDDHRWHASFNIGGTDTWRWSSSEHPFGIGANLQNLDDDLRRAFVADPGYILFSCDQQGAESRAVAYLSGDENYIQAVNSGDVHSMVALMTFGFDKGLDQKQLREMADRKYYRDYSYRDMCKKLGHGSNYFGKPPTLAKNAQIDVGMATEFQKQYFKAFPQIPKWHDWTIAKIQTDGFLDTAFGNRRHFWQRTWDESTWRAAIAFVPQSLVGQLTARALYYLWKEHAPLIMIMNNIHDAVMGQFPIDKVEELMPVVIKTITQPLQITDIKGVTRTMTVPWEPSYGANWGKQNSKNPDGLRLWVPET
jgi:DNA polymerase-1